MSFRRKITKVRDARPGMRMKLVFSLSAIAVTLLISSIISVMEFTRMNNYVSDLFAGNIKYEKADYDGAIALFQKSIDNAGDVALVRSAAIHGLAAAKMEKGDLSAAAKLLEDFVSEFGKRTGDKEDRYQKEEPQDEVPMVADAMWKLALVYQQLGANDKAKNTAERIIEVYGDNQQYADKAKKFVAAL